jgi:hypothetical protein
VEVAQAVAVVVQAAIVRLQGKARYLMLLTPSRSALAGLAVLLDQPIVELRAAVQFSVLALLPVVAVAVAEMLLPGCLADQVAAGQDCSTLPGVLAAQEIRQAHLPFKVTTAATAVGLLRTMEVAGVVDRAALALTARGRAGAMAV